MSARRLMIGGLLTVLLTVLEMSWIMVILAGCFPTPGEGRKQQAVSSSQDDLTTQPSCSVGVVRYPTDAAAMNKLYAGRAFYADGNHLGHDLALPEGTPIHPVGCGILRVYRAAKGYGRLVVVIEYRLEKAVTVKNGLGEEVEIKSFLSFEGHLRRGKNRQETLGVLSWKAGDIVHPDDVIGYVDDDAENGDGAEHLHLGIRLQSAKQAEGTDVNWFRGYDTKPSQRKWFADPALFLPALMGQTQVAFWHPPGTVMLRAKDGSAWMAEAKHRRSAIEDEALYGENLIARAVTVTDEELLCYDTAGTYFSPRAGHAVVKFDDASTVYEYTGLGPGEWRKAFISQDAFNSWGWVESDVEVWSAFDRAGFFSETEDKGFQTLRDGSLVKGDEESEVCVVSEGKRRPIADWATFVLLGYKPENILVLPQAVLEGVAGQRGQVIAFADTQMCAYPANCPGGDPEPCQDQSTSSSSSSSSGKSDSVEDAPIEPEPQDEEENASSSASGSSGVGGSENQAPSQYVHLHYEGPIEPGLIEFQGMWDPPGAAFFDWEPSTFKLCEDDEPGDGWFDCDLPAPSGTTNLLFTLHLPSGRWWGDLSCTPSGGCGQTIGQITLTNSYGYVPYVLKPNNAGSDYNNGFVSLVP